MPGLKIISARYGTLDVTSTAQSYVNGDALNIVVGNHLFGDPAVGQAKQFAITYEIGGVRKSEVFKEGGTVNINVRKKKFSVIIGFRNAIDDRLRNLNYTIAYYRKHLPEAELIVVEQDSRTDLGNRVDKHLYINTGNDFYSRSRGFNEGYNVSTGDYIIMADGDCLLDTSFFEKIHNYYAQFDSYFVIPYSNPVYYLSKEETEGFISTGQDNTGNNQTRKTEALKNASGGIGIVSAENFYRVGGFDPRFKGWGVEDDAFNNKCIGLGLQSKRLDHQMVHLHHADSFQGGENYGYNVMVYNTDYAKKSAKDIVRDIGFSHLQKEVDLDRIKIVCNTQHEELYQHSKSFYEQLPFECITVSGKTGLYSQPFFDHVIRNLTDTDWMIYLDEDCFVTDLGAMLELLFYQIRYNLGFSGMPDGGVVSHRFHNPVSINAFFTIVNLKELRRGYEGFNGKSLYAADLDKFTPHELIKKSGSYKVSYDNFEPYYTTFFYALRKGMTPLYLDADDTELDEYTTALKNHQGKIFAYHSWYSRSWNDPKNQQRILRVIDHCKELVSKNCSQVCWFS